MLPNKGFREEVRHIDSDELERVEIDTDHLIGLGQLRADGAVFAKRASGRNKHTVAAGRWENCGCVPVTSECNAPESRGADGPPRYSERTTMSTS